MHGFCVFAGLGPSICAAHVWRSLGGVHSGDPGWEARVLPRYAVTTACILGFDYTSNCFLANELFRYAVTTAVFAGALRALYAFSISLSRKDVMLPQRESQSESVWHLCKASTRGKAG